MALINIIWGIFEGFTKEGIYADKRACKSHRMVGHPSEKDFKSIVRKTWSKTDLLLTLTSLILTTCFVQTSLVPEERWYNRIRIGWLWIMLLYLRIFGIKKVFITLVAYLMFVNGTQLLITKSHSIKFVTVEHIPTRTAKQLSKYFKRL